MPLDILNIDIEPTELRIDLIKTAMDALEEVPGFWKAWISQSPHNCSFSIRVDGPDGRHFSYRFKKPHERYPEFVFRTIYDGARRVSRLHAA